MPAYENERRDKRSFHHEKIDVGRAVGVLSLKFFKKCPPHYCELSNDNHKFEMLINTTVKRRGERRKNEKGL